MRVANRCGSFMGGILMGGIVFLIAAAVFFFVGNNIRKMRSRCTESTQGIVSYVQKVNKTKGSGQKKTKYTVYVTDYYFIAEGSKYADTVEIKQNVSPPKKGNAITVNYDLADPDEAHYTKYDKGAVGYLVTAGAMGAFGIVAIVCGIFPQLIEDRL